MAEDGLEKFPLRKINLKKWEQHAGHNINKVAIDVMLDNLKKFKEYWTETFYVRGNPWAVHFLKIKPQKGETDKSSLAVYLIPKIDKLLRNWVTVGSGTVEIFSNQSNVGSNLGELEPHCFEAGTISSGKGYLIEWNELMDPEKGYVFNDKCKIVVNVKASPLQFPKDDKLLEFLPIVKCCDGASKGEFRIKMNEVFNFVDVCSPRFTLKHFPWRIIVCKTSTPKEENDLKRFFMFENGRNKDNLMVQLYNPSMANETEISCKVSVTCKLVSFDSATKPFLKNLENIEFKYRSSKHGMHIIPWNELMNPQKKFVQNDSFVLEISIEVEETKEQEVARALERKTNDEDNNKGYIRLECPICYHWLTDQPMSVLICGHLFCNDCVLLHLKSKRICPTCSTVIPDGELQKVYLPTK